MPITPAQLLNWKRQRRPIVALTAWDTAIAAILDEAVVEIILVGDSLGMVALGYETTLPVTLEAMIHHAAAVKRGVKRALVICDLPFLSYQASPAQAIQSAGRVLKETGAQAVKLEGGHPRMVETVSRLTEIGIPVMGHVGLTPQSVHQLGYRQQGQDPITADGIHNQAIALEKAGSFAVVLEHIPAPLATEISQGLTIPTIGIGAGSGCDGQVLVTADLLGLTPKQPPFAPAQINLRQIITNTVNQYSESVRQGQF
ncbi:MAG: alpha-ketopantoate hydroxymethyl transferase [Cyanobacteriota bacterium]|jgi:3-methyl-2-oxobutanoate hydroxymethyltransferase